VVREEEVELGVELVEGLPHESAQQNRVTEGKEWFGGRLSLRRWVVFNVLEIGESERLVPVVVVEVDLRGVACVDCVEPVVHNYVVVGASGTRIQIEYEGYVASMILANSKEHVSLGSRSESW